MSKLRWSIIAAVGVVPSLVFGSIVQSNQTDGGSWTAFPCSSFDLIDTSQSLVSNTTVSITPQFGSPNALNDGVLGSPGNVVNSSIVGDDNNPTWSVTYYLKTSVNLNGYSITNISTFAGWPDNRASQQYEVFLAFTTAPGTFISYGSYSVSSGGGSSKIELTDTSGEIATNVCAIRFTFSKPGAGTIYHEIDVFGSAMPLQALQTPVIASSNATDVTSTSATLNGYLSGTGTAVTTVFVYWGTADGGTNASSWGHTNVFVGEAAPGVFSTNVSLSVPNITYYYRYCATTLMGSPGRIHRQISWRALCPPVPASVRQAEPSPTLPGTGSIRSPAMERSLSVPTAMLKCWWWRVEAVAVHATPAVVARED